MAGERVKVLQAVEDLWRRALPAADIARNKSKAGRVMPGGRVIVRDGDPGEPTDIILSPLTYTYAHRVPIDVAAYAEGPKSAADVLTEMLTAVSLEHAKDRTLGGLCEWSEFEAPAPDDAEPAAGEPFRWAEVVLVCTYDTRHPLA